MAYADVPDRVREAATVIASIRGELFRYGSDDETIIHVRVNDDRSRRTYGSKTDAYRVFRRMLAGRDPPDTWDQVVSHAKGNTRRLRRAAPPDDADG